MITGCKFDLREISAILSSVESFKKQELELLQCKKKTVNRSVFHCNTLFGLFEEYGFACYLE